MDEDENMGLYDIHGNINLRKMEDSSRKCEAFVSSWVCF